MKRTVIIPVLLSCLSIIIIGLNSCAGSQKEIIPSSEFAPYINAYTGGVISQSSPIRIELTQDQPVVDLNNELKETTGTLPAILPDAVHTCYIGKNFKGQIDEIRVWKKALEQKDFFWNNTLNKFNPNYDTLVSYWKCDQEQCENLVDYQFAHHGIINNLQRVVVEDNAVMRYRIVTGYTNLMRFTDRGNINRDMFLMTNDLILLSAKVQQDGSLFPE